MRILCPKPALRASGTHAPSGHHFIGFILDRGRQELEGHSQGKGAPPVHLRSDRPLRLPRGEEPHAPHDLHPMIPRRIGLGPKRPTCRSVSRKPRNILVPGWRNAALYPTRSLPVSPASVEQFRNSLPVSPASLEQFRNSLRGSVRTRIQPMIDLPRQVSIRVEPDQPIGCHETCPVASVRDEPTRPPLKR